MERSLHAPALERCQGLHNSVQGISSQSAVAVEEAAIKYEPEPPLYNPKARIGELSVHS
jgi:hypothetical protein